MVWEEPPLDSLYRSKANGMNEAQRALLVEDNRGDVELFRDVFEELKTGMTLDVAFHNGSIPDVLSELSSVQPEKLPKIIFLDINLPGFSGLEILDRIRKSDVIRFVPVVILTSSGNPKDIADAYKLGASGYIVKPMDYDHLLEKVKTTLSFWLNICAVPDVNH